MRGRATFIALACAALVAAPVGSAAARRGGGPRGRVNGKPTLPIGCSHGGAPFVTHGPRGRKRIAIGFDDGPSDYTPRVLRVLRRFDSHATFFEIGQETAGRISTMRKILAQGNEIGNHSLHHEMDPSSASLRETNRLIRSATGFRPCDFRPPGWRGQQRPDPARPRPTDDHRQLGGRSEGLGQPRGRGDHLNVIHNAHNGSIVVMHDGGGNRSETVAALPAILSHFRHRGLQLRHRGRAARSRVHLPGVAQPRSRHRPRIILRVPKANPKSLLERAPKERLPGQIDPMLAKPGEVPESDSDEWAYEIKWDGVRVLGLRQPRQVADAEPAQEEVTARYPELEAIAEAIAEHAAILDGEVVALDDDGRPRFQLIQSRMGLDLGGRGQGAHEASSRSTT